MDHGVQKQQCSPKKAKSRLKRPSFQLSPPSLGIEKMWHQHMIDTLQYVEGCEAICVRFIQHHENHDRDCDLLVGDQDSEGFSGCIPGGCTEVSIYRQDSSCALCISDSNRD
jgi:hypothetical protein